MNRVVAVIAILFLILSAVSSSCKEPLGKWNVVEKFSYKWAGEDTEPYEFVLRVPTDKDDLENFTWLQISRKGKVIFELIDKWGPFVKFDNKYVTITFSDLLKKSCLVNPLNSDYLLLLPNVTSRSKFPLLFIFGWAYASDPGSLHVISLCDDGVPIEILALETFDIFDIKDLDGDSIPEIIGKKCSSQGWGEGFKTYDPYSVFRFGLTAASHMTLDMALSQKYNEENYYGWAGIKCREDVTVVLHPPGGGKPVIMDSKKAEALIEKKEQR